MLTGEEIKKQVSLGKIHIEPFFEENLNPNSYNFKLGNKLKVYRGKILDSAKENDFEEIIIPKEGLVLEPNKLYLGNTVEEIGSDSFVPIMQARSSVGRLGLFIYLNSGLGDLGFKRQWTLELGVVQPLRIYPNMKVGQITFWEVIGEITLYNGKYKNSVGSDASKIWEEFKQLKEDSLGR